jgi:hypothetical protein
VLLLLGKRVLWLYLISELLMLLCSVTFFAIVWINNLGAAHGFSRPELVFPVLTCAVFSGVPLVLAARLLRKGVVEP